jgi:multiple sugar transport system ATP-binding protein
MASIRFDHVVKRFGATPVLPDLDLVIADREFFTFVGPSGCGKSTLLNLIAGLESLSGGNLYLDDQRVNELPPRDRDVAMVFQNYALYPHLTVFDNIAFPLRVRKADRDTVAGAVREVAALLGLEAMLQRKPRELSGGQRQRVALGRALVRRPRAFLMDEPLSNLDARLRIETRAELKRLHAEYHVTTVYVTHDQEEALALSDRIAVIHQGRLQQIGTPDQIYHRPANRFVAAFIGSPPMNLLDGSRLEDLPVVTARVSGRAPASVEFGARPCDVIVRPRAEGPALEARVLAIEPVGRDTWVDGLWNGLPLKGCLAPGSEVAPGRPAFFHLPPDRLHAFDKSSGARLEA